MADTTISVNFLKLIILILLKTGLKLIKHF